MGNLKLKQIPTSVFGVVFNAICSISGFLRTKQAESVFFFCIRRKILDKSEEQGKCIPLVIIFFPAEVVLIISEAKMMSIKKNLVGQSRFLNFLVLFLLIQGEAYYVASVGEKRVWFILN